MSEEINNEEEEVYIEHMCAKHILHPEFGEGVVLEGQHDVPDENGYISWYTVQFDHGTETIQTEDVKIMHESHHGHMMKKKKKKMSEEEHSDQEEVEVSESLHIESMIDHIVDGQNSAAKEDFDNALAMKITQALDAKKQEVAASLYNEDMHDVDDSLPAEAKKKMHTKEVKFKGAEKGKDAVTKG